MPESISIIVTCYNLDLYIGDCIRSVLQQDYLGLFELIVVDDCSSDQSAKVIRTFDQVKYYRNKTNLGVLGAAIVGIEHATGDLLLFLDGDDIWHLNKLSRVVEKFRDDTTLVLVTHDIEYIDGSGVVLRKKSRPQQVLSPVSDEQRGQLVRDGILLHGDYVWLGSALSIRRSKCDVDGFIRFVETLADFKNTYQDWPLAFWAMTRSGAEAAYIDVKLIQYRLHGANYSGDASDLQKAMRNLSRSRNTMDAICKIASGAKVAARVVETSEAFRDYYGFLVDLYSGNRVKALLEFPGLVPFWLRGGRTSLKEIVRFLGVFTLGGARFILYSRRISTAVSRLIVTRHL